MLILGLIVFGLMAGALAQLILGRSGWKINWTMALVTGLLGSFVDADLVDELCLTISPNLVSGDAPRIAHSDNDDAALHRLRPVHLLTDTDGYVFSRWSR